MNTIYIDLIDFDMIDQKHGSPTVIGKGMDPLQEETKQKIDFAKRRKKEKTILAHFDRRSRSFEGATPTMNACGRKYQLGDDDKTKPHGIGLGFVHLMCYQ
jgi:hypothetical protein